MDDVVQLDLIPLSVMLASGNPKSSELSSAEWLGVVEIFTLLLSENSEALAEDGWKTCSAAFTHALDSAVQASAFGRREAVIRRLNLAVVLLRVHSIRLGMKFSTPNSC